MSGSGRRAISCLRPRRKNWLATPKPPLIQRLPNRVLQQITEFIDDLPLLIGYAGISEPSRSQAACREGRTPCRPIFLLVVGQKRLVGRHGGRPAHENEHRRERPGIRYRFAPFASSLAAETTASTVKPNFFTSFCRGADSPNVLMPMRAPSIPT